MPELINKDIYYPGEFLNRLLDLQVSFNLDAALILANEFLAAESQGYVPSERTERLFKWLSDKVEEEKNG